MITKHCVARYIEFNNKVVCGEENTPWLINTDILADFELDEMRYAGFCEECLSKKNALERKKAYLCKLKQLSSEK